MAAVVEKLPLLNANHFEVRIVSSHLGTPAAAAGELAHSNRLGCAKAVLVKNCLEPPRWMSARH